jgi:hypothetical protein
MDLHDRPHHRVPPDCGSFLGRHPFEVRLGGKLSKESLLGNALTRDGVNSSNARDLRGSVAFQERL